MISKELVDKINSLWHKQKTVGLTEEEKQEQKAVREEYLAAIRVQVRGMLDDLTRPQENCHDHHNHDHGCSCGHSENQIKHN